MDCRAFELLISEYLEGTLSEEVASAFMAHLFSCSVCRALVDDVRAAWELCRSLEEVEPSPDLSERLSLILRGAAMSCEAFEELISHYFDGVLTAAEYHLFEAHTRVCARCRQTLDDVAAVTRLLGEVGQVAVPEALHERILRATSSLQVDLRRNRWWRWRRQWAAWRLGWHLALRTPALPRWAMAMILCLATSGVVLLNLPASRSEIAPRPPIARLFDRVAGVRTGGERMVEHLERWRAHASDFLQVFRLGRRSVTSPAPAKKPSP
ncbi:hypothetical protein HRbin10_00322 [bacterium HR10]|nr:hypothetical protein HRbin10_00322 [bacterium HR10]